MSGNTVLQYSSLALGAIGTTLGVINTWRSFTKDRIKLRVTPMQAHPVGAANPDIVFSINVLNLSSFPVTINEVGFLYSGTTARGVIFMPTLTDGTSLPRTLEPRTSISVVVFGKALPELLKHHVKCAYATTACGARSTGTSPALEQLAAVSLR